MDKTGDSGNNHLTGTSDADHLVGLGGDDVLVGGDGDDILEGGDGNDFLQGDDGNDLLTGGAGNDTFYLETGLGTTTTITDFQPGDLLDVSSMLIGKFASIQPFIHADGADTVIALFVNGQDYSFVLKNVDPSSLTEASFVFDHIVSQVHVTGSDKADVLFGDGGDNVIDGRGGDDIMVGGAGNDHYVVDSAGDVVTELAGDGTDTVETTSDYVLNDNVEILIARGTATLHVTGNAAANDLYGNDAASVLMGAGGDDTYHVRAGNTVVENDGQGVDTVIAAFDFTLGQNVENLNLSGTADLNGTGNAGDNALSGTSGANGLFGLGGSDILLGRAGNDHLDGGAGNDTLYGGDGDDVLTGGTGNDRLSGGNGNDRFVVSHGSGHDVVSDFSAGDVIDASGNGGFSAYLGLQQVGKDTLVVFSGGDSVLLKNITATSLTPANFAFAEGAAPTAGSDAGETVTGTAGDDVINGMGGADTLYGLDGRDTLYGGTGADTLVGGTGNDSYIVDNHGDVVVELAGGGWDTVYSSVDFTLSAHVEKLALTGSGNITGTGNAGANSIFGNDGNNILNGGDGNDALGGGLGNDSLDGGAGNNLLKGGRGDDSYYVHAGDTVVEYSNAGNDTVYSVGNYTLGYNLENLVLTGAAGSYAVGNKLDNHLTGGTGNDVLKGGAGNDVLNGGLGADVMVGGQGDDTFHVDNVADKVLEYNGDGNDSVISSVSFTLGSYVENLTLTGTANLDAMGNRQDNILVGNDGNNHLNGGNGHDTLTGGLGADTFVFAGHSGDDIVTDFQSQADWIDVSAFTHGTAHGGYIHQSGADATIDLGGGNVITVLNISATNQAFLGHIIW